LEKRSKQIYRELSEDLKDTNAALSKSRSEFRRHLYIADLAEAYRSYGNWDIDGVIQRLSPYQPQDNDLVDEIRGEDQDLRGFEWRLLMALCAPPESKLLGRHQGSAYEVASIPGTDEFLSSGGDGQVRHWHLDSGNLKTFELGGEINALAVSVDGKYFVAGQNGSGKTKQMAIYRVEDGELVRELKRHRNSVESVAFSPDGRFVATADRYRDLFLHTIDGEFRKNLWTGSRNESLAFAPDGKSILAVVRDENGTESLGVYSVPELEEQRRLRLPFNIKFFSFSGDRKRLVAAGSASIAIYSWPSCQLLAMDDAPRGGICHVALNGDGSKLVAGFENGLLFAWELDQLSKDSDELPRPLVMSTGKRSVSSITFTPSHRMVLCTKSGDVQVWETINDQELPLRLDQTVEKVSAESADAEDMAVRLRDGSVARFNFHRRDFEVIQNVPPDRHLYVARSPDKKLIVASAPGELFALSAETGQIIKRMKVQIPNDPTDGLVFTADGSRLLHLLNDRFEIYSVGPRAEDWEKIGERLLDHDGVEEITVSPNADHNVVAVTTTADLIIFDGEDFEQRIRIPEQFGGLNFVRYSSDGSLFAVGYLDGTVEVFRANDFTTLTTMKGHQNRVTTCVWIEDNQTLATGSTDEIRLWDVPSGRALGMFPSRNHVNYLHFCPAEDSLFSFVENAPVQVWDAN
jgi:WD40 repeat protein